MTSKARHKSAQRAYLNDPITHRLVDYLADAVADRIVVHVSEGYESCRVPLGRLKELAFALARYFILYGTAAVHYDKRRDPTCWQMVDPLKLERRHGDWYFLPYSAPPTRLTKTMFANHDGNSQITPEAISEMRQRIRGQLLGTTTNSLTYALTIADYILKPEWFEAAGTDVINSLSGSIGRLVFGAKAGKLSFRWLNDRQYKLELKRRRKTEVSLPELPGGE